MKRCKAFVLGAMVGIIGGLLLAPKSGKEMRKDLLAKTEELKLKLKSLNELDSDELGEVVANKIKEIRKSIENFDWKTSRDSALNKFEEMKEKISDIGESISTEVAKRSNVPVINATPVTSPEINGALDAVIENINSKYDD